MIDNRTVVRFFQPLVDKLQQAGKIDNLQQVCGAFGCVEVVSVYRLFSLRS